MSLLAKHAAVTLVAVILGVLLNLWIGPETQDGTKLIFAFVVVLLNAGTLILSLARNTWKKGRHP